MLTLSDAGFCFQYSTALTGSNLYEAVSVSFISKDPGRMLSESRTMESAATTIFLYRRLEPVFTTGNCAAARTALSRVSRRIKCRHKVFKSREFTFKIGKIRGFIVLYL